MILGSTGSGKSTFARRLGARLGLPVVHLDRLFWEPGWSEPNNDDFLARVKSAIAGDAWITDGNYISRTFGLRLPCADAVIFLSQPRWLCIGRVIWRWLTNFGRRRPDMADGCRENFSWDLLDFAWNFDRITRPRIERIIAETTPPVPVVRLHGDRAIAAFLKAPAFD